MVDGGSVRRRFGRGDRRGGLVLRDAAAMLGLGVLAGVFALAACDGSGPPTPSGGSGGASGGAGGAGGSGGASNPLDYLGEVGAARRRGGAVSSLQQLRQLVQVMQVYQAANGRWPAGQKASERLKMLIDEGSLPPGMLVVDRGDAEAWTGGAFGPAHFSYALLASASPGWVSPNDQTPWACDRLLDDGGSVFGRPWRGGIGWGDGHATVSESRVVRTRIGGVIRADDDLFEGDASADAVMLHE